MKAFIQFIREQGVVGLAVGFILGGAVSKMVSALVENIIMPVIGLILGSASDFSSLAVNIGRNGSTNMLKYGAFISTFVDFIIIAAVVYYGFSLLGLNKIDKSK